MSIVPHNRVFRHLFLCDGLSLYQAFVGRRRITHHHHNLSVLIEACRRLYASEEDIKSCEIDFWRNECHLVATLLPDGTLVDYTKERRAR